MEAGRAVAFAHIEDTASAALDLVELVTVARHRSTTAPRRRRAGRYCADERHRRAAGGRLALALARWRRCGSMRGSRRSALRAIRVEACDVARNCRRRPSTPPRCRALAGNFASRSTLKSAREAFWSPALPAVRALAWWCSVSGRSKPAPASALLEGTRSRGVCGRPRRAMDKLVKQFPGEVCWMRNPC